MSDTKNDGTGEEKKEDLLYEFANDFINVTVNNFKAKTNESETAPVALEYASYEIEFQDMLTMSGKKSFDGKTFNREKSIEGKINDITGKLKSTESQGITDSGAYESKQSHSASVKVKNVEFETGSEESVGYDAAKGGVTHGHGANSSVKVGNNDFNAKLKGGTSYKEGGEGYSSKKDSVGVDAKAGPVELGAEKSHTDEYSNKNGEKKETEKDGKKVKGGVDIGGVKVSHSVETEKSHSTTERSDSATEEESTKHTHSTRIEVDTSKHGAVAVGAAAAFNMIVGSIQKEAAEQDEKDNTVKVEHGPVADNNESNDYYYGYGY